MSFREVAESNLLYACVIVGILLVAAAAVFYLIVCYKHAVEIGVDKSVIKNIIKSSVSFAVVPSIAIVVGFVSLAAVIGIPYSWFRLSVIGSVAYELMASNMALDALGLDLATADGYAFGLMMWAMCLGMTVGIVVNIFIVKKVHLGTLKIGKGDERWGALSQTVFMTTLITVLVTPMLVSDLPTLFTFITSAMIAVVITVIAKKLKAVWLENFTLAFSLVGAMASSVLWVNLF
ncbi:MAG: DUF5058 family protein [Peptostreptococcaceae bacterium]|nr:DUF5058 family protein [Peptostreptococcaceae bacterium]